MGRGMVIGDLCSNRGPPQLTINIDTKHLPRYYSPGVSKLLRNQRADGRLEPGMRATIRMSHTLNTIFRITLT